MTESDRGGEEQGDCCREYGRDSQRERMGSKCDCTHAVRAVCETEVEVEV
jgi:hypothetical protein